MQAYEQRLRKTQSAILTYIHTDMHTYIHTDIQSDKDTYIYIHT